MAQLPQLRHLNVLRSNILDFQHMVLREGFTKPAHHLRLPYSARSFHHIPTSSSELCTRQRRLPRPFHPPRRSQLQQRRFQSNKPSQGARPQPDPTAELGSPPGKPPLSLSERLRKLSREYGWSALGVYLALSALDFPFCFLAVRMVGTERIAQYEHTVVRGFWTVASMPFPGGEEQVRGLFRNVGEVINGGLEAVGLRKAMDQAAQAGKPELVISKVTGEAPDGAVLEKEWTWGVDEAQAAHQSNASLATQLALAYAIHKSFIFVRVPLTAAVLPRVVRTLRGWGWNIGKRPSKKPSKS